MTHAHCLSPGAGEVKEFGFQDIPDEMPRITEVAADAPAVEGDEEAAVAQREAAAGEAAAPETGTATALLAYLSQRSETIHCFLRLQG